MLRSPRPIGGLPPRSLSLALMLLFALVGGPPTVWAQPRARVLMDVGQGTPTAAERAVMAALNRAGYQTEALPVAVLAEPGAPDAADARLLVLSRADRLPVAVAPALDAFLRRGGRLIALRAPAWQTPLIRHEGRWMTTAQYHRATAAVPPENRLFDFTSESLREWERTTNAPDSPVKHLSEPVGLPGADRALHVRIGNLTSWDTYVSPTLERPFPEGHALTVFAAKGGPNTRQLAIEWQERDLSRWIAVVPLTSEWRRYALPPAAFRYWQSNPARGGPGDRFRPENAARVSFGLAFTHTIQVGGAHQYWVANVGTARATAEAEQDPTAVQMPPTDGLYPPYKFYRVTNPVALSPGPDAAPVVGAGRLPAASAVLSPHPRPRGVGVDKGRDWRWLPLVGATARDGDWRGQPGALLLWMGGPYKGAMLATFGVQDSAFYAHPATVSLLGRVAAAMRQGVFFQEAGAHAFTYFADETPTFGARAVNFGDQTASCTIRLRVAPKVGGKPLLAMAWTAPLEPGGTVERRTTLRRVRWPKDGLTVRVDLLRDGQVVDRIAHDVYVWRPPARPAFMRTGRGEFLLRGKPWRAHGVNYMPSSGIASEDGDYFERWINRRSYDPQIIERDLRRVRAMGLNSVSAFIYGSSVPSRNLLDFLRLCEKHDLKVNLSMRPGTPMDFQWNEIRSIMRAYRLWLNDTVFAYDLAWEPSLGGHDARKVWDREWERWIVDRYSSVEAAERDWGYPAPRADGKVTNPSGAQLTADGPWRVMVSAYRHFADSLLYRKYHAAGQMVRSVDPNHLISFRMSEAGNPTYNWDAFMPYDFPGLAAAVDLLAPEAYGRIGDWEKVKPGVFEVAYARAFAPEKPVIWAEMGMSTVDIARQVNDPKLLARQAAYHRDFYRLLRLSRSNGIYFWWYPGGFRYGENSDFGIINPDGTDRPVTTVIRQAAKGFLGMPPVAAPDAWIMIDRDAHPTGVFGIYEGAKAAFWRAVAAGKRPGLRTAAEGKDSRTVPLTAVGNRPFTGQNPPKHLDTAFDKVVVSRPGARPQAVADGATFSVPARGSLLLTVTLRNLSRATWRGRPGDFRTKGLVRLEARFNEAAASSLPAINGRRAVAPVVTDIPPHGRATVLLSLPTPAAGETTEVVLRPVVQGRAAFGDAFRLRIRGIP